MRTYDALTFQEAKRQWADFDREWRWLRELSWERGFPYPPAGTRHDDRDAAEPSQRAVIYRALAENPTQLRAIVLRSKSWSQVIDGIFGLEDRLRTEAGLSEDNAAWERKDHNHRTAVMSLGQIIKRLSDS